MTIRRVFLAFAIFVSAGVVSACSYTKSSLTGPATCTYTASQVSQNIGYQGGPGSFSVSTQSGCSWTATSSNLVAVGFTNGVLGPPITVATGTGSGTVYYTVSGNGGPARTTTITGPWSPPVTIVQSSQ